ncbi:hypothetical protein C8J56DRAFT_1054353 [Mycena floridula]|nr:hypothetical protein C8J56DRAFT_1054353 [Mycena floridula]
MQADKSVSQLFNLGSTPSSFVLFLTKREELKLSTESSSILTSAGGKVQRLSAAGSPFAGREASGGTRAQVYGNSMYESGYPGVGVVASLVDLFPSTTGPWLGVVSQELVAELIFTIQSRPGGVMTYALFPSNTGSTTFRLVAHATTVSDLTHDITSACSSSLNKSTTSTSPVAFNDIAETRYRLWAHECNTALLQLSTASSHGPSASPTALHLGRIHAISGPSASLMDSSRIITILPQYHQRHTLWLQHLVSKEGCILKRLRCLVSGKMAKNSEISTLLCVVCGQSETAISLSIHGTAIRRMHKNLHSRLFALSSTKLFVFPAVSDNKPHIFPLLRTAKILYPARLSVPATMNFGVTRPTNPDPHGGSMLIHQKQSFRTLPDAKYIRRWPRIVRYLLPSRSSYRGGMADETSPRHICTLAKRVRRGFEGDEAAAREGYYVYWDAANSRSRPPIPPTPQHPSSSLN